MSSPTSRLYDVLPLDDRFAERMDAALRPGFFVGRKELTLFPGMGRLPEGGAPKTANVDHVVDGNRGARKTAPGMPSGATIRRMGYARPTESMLETAKTMLATCAKTARISSSSAAQ